MNSNWSYSPETPNLVQIRWFVEPCDLEIWRMTLQNNRAPLLCYFKLSVSFHNPWWFQISITVRKPSIRVKMYEPWDLEILRMILKKQKGISFMLLQALWIISYPFVNSNWSYNPETPNLGKIRQFLEPRDLEIWRMTFKNNRTPILCYFKLCAAFHSHWWIKKWVAVRKRPIWVKFEDF